MLKNIKLDGATTIFRTYKIIISNPRKVDDVLGEWNDFISHDNKGDRKDINALVKEIETYLHEIKSD